MRKAAALLAAIVFSSGAVQTVCAQSPPATIYRNLPYADHFRQKLDIYVPVQGCGPFPVAIFVYGGGWLVGEKEDVAPYLDSLLERGLAVAAINHRYSYQAPFPAQIHDIKGAVRFLRANAEACDLDPTRFGIFGPSSGGHLSALMGTSAGVASLEGTEGGNLEHSSAVQAVFDMAGPTDLFALATDTVSQLFNHSIQDIIEHMKDPAYAELVALVHSANPVQHATRGDAPAYLAHGAEDPMVPLIQSELLVNALAAVNVPVTLQVVDCACHDIDFAAIELGFDFLEQALGAALRPADLNCDGAVNVSDLLELISLWGACRTTEGCRADLNHDAMVDITDLLALIDDWG